jgi:very-short-patch-repair endonuclease
MIPKLNLYAKRYSAQLVGKMAGLPKPQEEVQFAAPRKWRFDFAWPELRIALEVEGGIWTNGRHSRGSGMKRDMEKYNTAASMGWLVFRVTPDAVYSPTALKLVNQAYVARRKELTNE